MDNYTKVMEQKAYEAAIEYYPKEKILEAVNTFHKFSDSLDDFLRDHGYAGDINDITGKTDFIKRSFEKSEIPVPVSYTHLRREQNHDSRYCRCHYPCTGTWILRIHYLQKTSG